MLKNKVVADWKPLNRYGSKSCRWSWFSLWLYFRSESLFPSLRRTWTCWRLRGSSTRPSCAKDSIFRKLSKDLSRYIQILHQHCPDSFRRKTVAELPSWTTIVWKMTLFVLCSKKENYGYLSPTPSTLPNRMQRTAKEPLHLGSCVWRDDFLKM